MLIQVASCFLLCCIVPLLKGTADAFDVPSNVSFPTKIILRAAVLTNTIPLAYYVSDDTSSKTRKDGSVDGFPEYRGFQPDLLRKLQGIAKSLDNVTLSFQLEEAPPFSYTDQFEYLASDCNTTLTPYTLTREDCLKYDLIVGDYYGYASRSMRATLSPPLLSTAGATLQYTRRKKRLISTLEEAHFLKEPVCLLEESFYDQRVLEQYPDLLIIWCKNHTQCIDFLKQETCALFVEDELQLRYIMVQDADLEVTRERFLEQYIVWPLNARLNPLFEALFIRWIYEAKVKGILDELYDAYFSINYCPIGKAGVDCNLPCSPSRGLADREGRCVCESTKWTGNDCSVEVLEDKNMIPAYMSIMGYLMLGTNFMLVAICAVWMFFQRNTMQVKVAQPLFLGLVLLGCLISTSTIIALRQDDKDGPVHACMAIPWLYSVGFSVTFGTLFAKIRRVYLIFKAAAQFQRLTITAQETIIIIGAVLLVDVTILTIWTLVDPLRWERHILLTDQFDNPLSSQGQCTSDNWVAFVGAIAALHFALLLKACYLCYAARDIPAEFSKTKYVALAMISNLQIFLVGVPILVILGSDSQTSFFVRSVIVWINDFAVVTLIFGSLVYEVHWDPDRGNQSLSRESFLRAALQSYIAAAHATANNNNNDNTYNRNCNNNVGSRTALDGNLEDHTPNQSRTIDRPQQFSTFDGTNRFSFYDGNNARIGPAFPTIPESDAADEVDFVPTVTDHEQEATPIPVLMTVSESEPRLHIDAGDGQRTTVPITQIRFDATSNSEQSTEFVFTINEEK